MYAAHLESSMPYIHQPGRGRAFGDSVHWCRHANPLSTKVQVLELRRFGADALLGEASLPLAAIPSDGRPQYLWLKVAQAMEGEATEGRALDREEAAALHIRVQWTRQDRQRCYNEIYISLAGIGVSMVDSLSARVLRELAYIHASDLQVSFLG
jgi:hypothetical protein